MFVESSLRFGWRGWDLGGMVQDVKDLELLKIIESNNGKGALEFQDKDAGMAGHADLCLVGIPCIDTLYEHARSLAGPARDTVCMKQEPQGSNESKLQKAWSAHAHGCKLGRKRSGV